VFTFTVASVRQFGSKLNLKSAEKFGGSTVSSKIVMAQSGVFVNKVLVTHLHCCGAPVGLWTGKESGANDTRHHGPGGRPHHPLGFQSRC